MQNLLRSRCVGAPRKGRVGLAVACGLLAAVQTLAPPPVAATGQQAAEADSRWLGISDRGTWSPDGESIVFHSTRDGNFEIYVMDADGSDPQRLTHNPWTDFWPAWSPDGTEIAFSSDREGWASTPSRNQIYLMNRDGTDVRQLTMESYDDRDPRRGASNNVYPLFHPDGWIAFLSNRGNGWLELYAMDRDGGNVRRLSYADRHLHNPFFSTGGELIYFDTHKDGFPTAAIRDGGWDLHAMPSTGGPIRNVTDNPRYEDYDGAISPDGGQIIYKRSDHAGLYIMGVDGAGQSDEPFYDEHAFSASWSPDGSRLLFTSERDGHRELYSMDAASRAVTRLTWSRPTGAPTQPAEAPSQAPHDYHATWSPDGSRVAFMRLFSDQRIDVFVIEVDSGVVSRLTDRAGKDQNPTWSPNGDLIAFCSDRDGEDYLHVMATDGTGVRRLTAHPISGCEGAWSPDGRRFALTSGDRGNNDVYIIDVGAATAPRRLQLTDGYELAVRGAWSPDGRRIVFCRPVDVPFDEDSAGPYDDFAIYVVGTEPGEQPEKLVDLEGEDSYASWAPDGRSIVFAHQAPVGQRGDLLYDVYEVDADGSDPRPLISAPGQQFGAAVSPDGRYVVYHSSESGRGAIWIADREGGNRRQLTNLHPG